MGTALRQFICGAVDPETVISLDAFFQGHLKGLQTQCIHVLFTQHTGSAAACDEIAPAADLFVAPADFRRYVHLDHELSYFRIAGYFETRGFESVPVSGSIS